MAKENATPEVKPEAPKKERKVLTPEQRIAKLEADLKAAREKAEAKAKQQAVKLYEKREKLVAKVDEALEQINRIDADLAAGGFEVPVDDATRLSQLRAV